VESHRLSHSIEHMLDSRDMRDGLN
jgi:hypothetical protein